MQNTSTLELTQHQNSTSSSNQHLSSPYTLRYSILGYILNSLSLNPTYYNSTCFLNPFQNQLKDSICASYLQCAFGGYLRTFSNSIDLHSTETVHLFIIQRLVRENRPQQRFNDIVSHQCLLTLETPYKECRLPPLTVTYRPESHEACSDFMTSINP